MKPAVDSLELRIAVQPIDQRIAVDVVPQQGADHLTPLRSLSGEGKRRVALAQCERTAPASAARTRPRPMTARPTGLKERWGTGLRVSGGAAGDKSAGLAIGGRPITFTRLVNHGA